MIPIEYTSEEWRKILEKSYTKTSVKCPICTAPIYVRKQTYLEPEKDKTLTVSVEQVCENHKCTYDVIRFYEIEIKP